MQFLDELVLRIEDASCLIRHRRNGFSPSLLSRPLLSHVLHLTLCNSHTASLSQGFTQPVHQAGIFFLVYFLDFVAFVLHASCRLTWRHIKVAVFNHSCLQHEERVTTDHVKPERISLFIESDWSNSSTLIFIAMTWGTMAHAWTCVHNAVYYSHALLLGIAELLCWSSLRLLGYKPAGGWLTSDSRLWEPQSLLSAQNMVPYYRWY